MKLIQDSVFHTYHIPSPSIRILPSVLAALLALVSPAFALRSVTLAWDASPESNLNGYRLKYGTSSGSYTQSIDVGNSTTATIPSLAEGNTYFFAVIAVSSSATESNPSNEVSLTISPNQAPVVVMTSPANGASAFAPATLTLGANASDSDGTVSRVEFYSGVTKLGEVTSSPYAYVRESLPSGTYTFTARAFDNEGASAQSGAVTVTITEQPVVSSPSAISTVSYVASTGVQLTVSGPAGQTQNVYVSNDLKTWTLLSSATNSTGTMTVSDANAVSFNQRFYRVSAGNETTDPVGFTKLRIAGKRQTTTGNSYLAVNLVNPSSYQGAVTSRGARSIVDAQADWTDGQFNGANGEFYLEVVSGPWAGLTTDILTTNAATKTLTTDDDLSPLLSGGEQYKIRKHRTIGDVFGKNNETKLKAGTSVSASDEVRLFNPVTQAFLVHYFNSSASGWRSSLNASADTSNTKLYLDQGVAVRRKTTGDLTLVVTGAVKTGQTVVPIGANSNLCANMYPAGTLTLGNSGLFSGNATTGLGGASKLSSADEVQIWNGTSFRRFFYKTSGSGGIGWRNSSNVKVDASSSQIANGSSVYVVRKNGRPPFNWKIGQPF